MCTKTIDQKVVVQPLENNDVFVLHEVEITCSRRGLEETNLKLESCEISVLKGSVKPMDVFFQLADTPAGSRDEKKPHYSKQIDDTLKDDRIFLRQKRVYVRVVLKGVVKQEVTARIRMRISATPTRTDNYAHVVDPTKLLSPGAVPSGQTRIVRQS